MSTVVRDFRKSPARLAITESAIYDAPDAVKKLRHTVCTSTNTALKQVPFNDRSKDMDYPTTIRTTKIRNELGKPIWALWRDGTIQCLPFLNKNNSSKRLIVSTVFEANRWCTASSIKSVTGIANRSYFMEISNPYEARNNQPHSRYHELIAEGISSSIVVDHDGDPLPRPTKADVDAYFKYDDIAKHPNGLYLPEFDVVLAVSDISDRISHPAILTLNANEERPPERLMRYDQHESIYFKIFIADREHRHSDTKFMKIGYKYLPVPVVRTYNGHDGVHVSDCLKYGADDFSEPIIHYEHFSFEDGFRIYNIKSSIEEHVEEEHNLRRARDIETRKLELDQLTIELKHREIEYKDLELRTKAAIDTARLNKEVIKELHVGYRQDLIANQNDARETKRFRRDMLSDTTKMITSVLALAAAVFVYANKKK